MLPPLRHPIVLAPMGGAAGPELVAAVGNAGGFPILPAAYSTPQKIAEDVARVRERTAAPFGINLFVETPPAPAEAAVRRAHERLRAFRDELGLAQPEPPPAPPAHYAEQLAAVIAARPAVFSFTFGIPDGATLAAFHDAGIATLGTATTVAEALALERAGVRGVVAQGAEAGAHRGTFIAPVAQSLVGTLALVPQIVDAVRIPVIAAGGIGDGRGIAAVLALGAVAAALGTTFLLAEESTIAPAYRATLQSEAARETTLITAFSGRAARGIENRFVREVTGDDIAPYPYQNALTRDIRNAAALAGKAEFLSLWAGQAARLARPEPAAAIVARLAGEADAAHRAVSERLSPR